jgi:hypothetical protein
MRRRLAAVCFGVLAGGALVASSGAASAHHSLAMFNQEHPITLEGTVVEFRFTSPHSFILLRVVQNGKTAVWRLEGLSPTALVRDGWSSKTVKPGDELRITVAPLRSGAPGCSWSTNQVSFRDGRPFVLVSH